MSPSAARKIDASLARVGAKIFNEGADRIFFRAVLCALASLLVLSSALLQIA